MKAHVTAIVVPLDGTSHAERALGPARDLALRIGVGLRLVSFVESRAEVVDCQRYLDGVQASLRGQDARLMPLTAALVAADPGEAIARESGPDEIICMASGASIFFHDAHVGSVTEAVIRNSRKPVVVVGPKVDPDRRLEIDKIIAPVDGSEVSETALPFAADWARLLDLPMWIVTVADPAERAGLVAVVGGEAAAAETSYVHNLAIDHGTGLDTEWDVLSRRDPVEALVERIGDTGMAVMSTHGRTGLARITLGSVTTRTVRRSKQPVVVVCPAGSPDT